MLAAIASGSKGGSGSDVVDGTGGGTSSTEEVSAGKAVGLVESEEVVGTET